jgi:hypothetical protein
MQKEKTYNLLNEVEKDNLSFRKKPGRSSFSRPLFMPQTSIALRPA